MFTAILIMTAAVRLQFQSLSMYLAANIIMSWTGMNTLSRLVHQESFLQLVQKVAIGIVQMILVVQN